MRPVGEASVERLEHLVADLVAAAADARADGGGRRLVEPRDRIREDPARQPAPAAVHHRDPVVARERDRQAVGDDHEQREVVASGDVAVHLLELAVGGVSHSLTSVPWTCQPIAIERVPMPAASASSSRLRSTRSRSSSVRMPRFSDSYGPSLTPPLRVENADLGAGQAQPDQLADRATSSA